jgi:serine/threonine-protein kinase RsbW
MEIAFNLCLPHDESSVGIVRHLCTSAMARLGVEDSCIHDVAVAVTEACTNVLQHAHGEEQYDVEIRVTEEEASIQVSDVGEGFDYESMRAVPPSGHMDESGRGLWLMRALVDTLEFASTEEHGNVVRLVKSLRLKQGALLADGSGRSTRG